METTRVSRVPRMVIRELLPTLKPRRQSLVGVAALTEITFNRKHSPLTLFEVEVQNTDHILLSDHLSRFLINLIQLEVSTCYCVIQTSQFSEQRVGQRELKDRCGRVDRFPAGKLILGSLIETLAYLLKYLRELLALDFPSSLVISTPLGFWVTSNYCLLPSSFPMIWGYQPLPKGEDFLHSRYLPITTCRYWINSHLVNCPSVSMRVFHPSNYAIVLPGYEIIVHSL